MVGLACASLTASAAAPPKQGSSKTLELFGMKLKGSDRQQLRAALAKGGLRPIRVNDNYWVDTYNAKGALEGASSFAAGYVQRSNVFAFGQYQFDAFMDTGLVTRVATMVAHKYGPPSSKVGNDGLGEVTYTWNLPEKMVIRVLRGWPESTTYLKFVDPAAEELP